MKKVLKAIWYGISAAFWNVFGWFQWITLSSIERHGACSDARSAFRNHQKYGMFLPILMIRCKRHGEYSWSRWLYNNYIYYRY